MASILVTLVGSNHVLWKFCFIVDMSVTGLGFAVATEAWHKIILSNHREISTIHFEVMIYLKGRCA